MREKGNAGHQRQGWERGSSQVAWAVASGYSCDSKNEVRAFPGREPGWHQLGQQQQMEGMEKENDDAV